MEIRAYRASYCKHEFTYWAPREPDPKRLGMMMQRSWSRTCTKCSATETTFSETEPVN